MRDVHKMRRQQYDIDNHVVDICVCVCVPVCKCSSNNVTIMFHCTKDLLTKLLERREHRRNGGKTVQTIKKMY